MPRRRRRLPSSITAANDNVARLATQTTDLAATANDLIQTFGYNPTSQISSVTRSNDLYAWTGHTNVNLSSTPNGLNQITNVGASTVTHDTKGNITAVGIDSYGYSSENFLTSGPGGATLGYDPMGRLYQVAQGSSTTRMGYDGLDRIAEYDGSNAIQRRYIHGPGVDNPIAWYEGSDLSSRRFLTADERGSIIAVTDSAGAVLALNKYDEYGVPQITNVGRFGYTGQAWLGEIGVWYYKARMYRPDIGRFLQTDPIGYSAGLNLYAYVLNDPVNWTDPLGLDPPNVDGGGCAPSDPPPCDVVNQPQPPPSNFGALLRSGTGVGGGGGGGGGRGNRTPDRNRDRPNDPCESVRNENGTIVANGLTTIVIVGLGLTVTTGTFRNIQTGSKGDFITVGVGAGFLGGVTDTQSTFNHISNFVGYGEAGSFGFVVPFASRIPGMGRLLSRYVGLGASVHQNVHNQRVGKTSDVGPGKVGAAATASETNISNCFVGGQ